MLSERISTWRPIRSGRKNWQARQTASISKQLMWKPLSVFDQWPKVGLPSHSAPQPVLEASVVTTFLVWTNPMATPFSIHRGFFQGVRAVTQRILSPQVQIGRWGKLEHQGRRPCPRPLISVSVSHRWRSSTTRLAIDLPMAWAVVLVARKARSVALLSSLRVAGSGSDSSTAERSLA